MSPIFDSRSFGLVTIACGAICLALVSSTSNAGESDWRKHTINDQSPYEAACAADFNGDGKLDVFCGDSWYEAPTWKRHKVRDVEVSRNPHYREDFADLPLDVNGDGNIDIVTCSYFGKRVGWVEHPGDPTKPWIEHTIDNPSNIECGQLYDINGDGQLDFLPNTVRVVTWYEITAKKPKVTWKKHDLGREGAGHGVGVGDINRDGRTDIITRKGWYEQPADKASDKWPFHAEFQLGSASILIIGKDFDGDGDTDILWGMGHAFGLFWLRQSKDASGKRVWTKESVDETFSQVHTLHLADLDGDSNPEVVTGKRIYAHETEPGATDKPCVYSFHYDRRKASWVKRVIYEGKPAANAPKNAKERWALKDFERGSVGTGLQIDAKDMDGDGDLDLVCPGKSGLYWLENPRKTKTALRTGDRALHTFDRVELTDVYYSEGASAGDINGDGHVDAVYGPHWYAGPDYKKSQEIYAAKPQNRERYADHFFSWVYDFDGDGRNDVFTVGFPGTPAYVYVNPGPDHLDRIWKKQQVFDWVSNESPHFIDLVGDERPELVCTRDGHFGYATIDWKRPLEAWTYHTISGQIASKRFGHGLGVGDINGDGRMDLLHADGWFEQPQNAATAESWTLHKTKFTDSYGGAEMYAYDVDGDGDNDVITSLAAHDFGLAWYEQQAKDGQITFKRHLIMGDRPNRNRYGLVFSEPHSVALHDIDGDGLKDIITGKTFYSHHKKSALWNAGAVVYWFKLVRSKQGVDWVPYLADADAGIGRQISIHDVNGDKLPDIVVGGMKGGNVLLHRSEKVDDKRWRAAQPTLAPRTAKRTDRGPSAPFDASTGRVVGAIEAETMRVVRVGDGKVRTQNMANFKSGRWSGGEQLFWTGAKPRARLELELDVAKAGTYELSAAFTTAKDYAIINLLLDSEALCQPIDLYDYPSVSTTGDLGFGTRKLTAGKHRLTVEITSANDSAVKAYMVGFDYLRLVSRD